MIRLTVKYPDGKKEIVLVPEQKPVKSVLESLEGYTPGDSVILNERKLSSEDLEKSFPDLGFGAAPEMTLTIEEDVPWFTEEDETSAKESNPFNEGSVIYPPKARIDGCACIITSAFTPEEIRDFRRYMPEALVLKNAEGEPLFAVDIDETSPGSINQYGVVFSKHTNREGNATATILLDPECEDCERLVRDKIGSAILSLVELEERLVKDVSRLEKRKALLMDHILKI